jgi:hypothetical protein
MADTAITVSPLRVSVLSNNERVNGFTHKIRVLYSDIALGTGATDTVTMTLGNTPAKFLVSKAAVNVKTAFAGTTAMTLIVGTTTDTGNFIASTSILTAGVIQPAAGLLATIAGSTGTAAVSLVATFTNATGGSPSALTAGELDILLSMRNTATELT